MRVRFPPVAPFMTPRHAADTGQGAGTAEQNTRPENGPSSGSKRVHVWHSEPSGEGSVFIRRKITEGSSPSCATSMILASHITPKGGDAHDDEGAVGSDPRRTVTPATTGRQACGRVAKLGSIYDDNYYGTTMSPTVIGHIWTADITGPQLG